MKICEYLKKMYTKSKMTVSKQSEYSASCPHASAQWKQHTIEAAFLSHKDEMIRSSGGGTHIETRGEEIFEFWREVPWFLLYEHRI
jgi:hypothetical protein